MADLLDRLTTPSLVVTALWQSTLWLALGLAVARASGRRPGRAHALLFVAAVGALLTPLATRAFAELGWGLLAPPAGAPEPGAPAPAALGPGAGATAAPAWERWFALAWALASGLLAARLVRSFLRSRAFLAGRTRPAGAVLDARARSAARALGLRSAPEVRLASGIGSPVVWAFGPRPLVLLPAGDGAGARTSVLCHELAHVKRGDHWTGLAAELLCCALPWHPLAWAAARRLAWLSERACDAWVLESGEDRYDYAATLLELAPARGATSVAAPGVPAAVSRGHGLAGRVRELVAGAPPAPRAGRRTTALACAVALLAGSGLALAQRWEELPQRADRAVPADVLAIAGELRLLPAELDLGVTEPGVPATGSLWLVNGTTEPVRIERVRAHCGCTTVRGLEPGTVLAPGAAVELIVTMDPAPAGESKSKDVSVEAEGGRLLVVPVRLATAAAR